MKLKYKIYSLSLMLLSSLGLASCVDNDIVAPDDSELKEMEKGFCLTFQMSLDPMGGNEFRTRAGGNDLSDIEDYINLEKVRILFFTCPDETDQDGNETPGVFYTQGGKRYETGKYDKFLFESKSRWVSEMESTSPTASKLWQVTAPVFSYGNQDKDYNWEAIRKALTEHPFKIVILANRPGEIPFADYDGTLASGGGEKFTFNNQGPYWGPQQSFSENTTINSLHHCQWDPVYTSKNQINGISGSSGSSNGNNVYDFIMGEPRQNVTSPDGEDAIENLMGAVSVWSQKDPSDNNNYAVHPGKITGGIPMYGVQKFEPIPNWQPGTPFNVSENQIGQDNSYASHTVSLLRSLVRLDLMIPRKLGDKDIIVQDVSLEYPNVMARCEPLDVATPTDLLWSYDNCNPETQSCEWYALQKKGLLIDTDYGSVSTGTGATTQQLEDLRNKFLQRLGWFYGAWKEWWDFNGLKNIVEPYFNGDSPHIFNPCVQRNSSVKLSRVLLEDDASYYHYVIYTGERCVNDPSNFRNLNILNSKISFFKFTIKYSDSSSETGKTYQLALTDYNKNDIIKGYLNSGVNLEAADGNSYLSKMARSPLPDNWNWVLMRNHIYRFVVNGIAGDLDKGGNDALVISTEERVAPTITYE